MNAWVIFWSESGGGAVGRVDREIASLTEPKVPSVGMATGRIGASERATGGEGDGGTRVSVVDD